MLQSMDSLGQLNPATILGGVFALFLFFLCNKLWKGRTSSASRLAPEPSGAWPLIGHLPMLFEPNIAHITLGSLANKYGPAFIMRLGIQKALVVSSWEVAKECFTTNDKAFATRPSSTAAKIMTYNNGFLNFAPYGPYWRETRKISIHELLSNHRLDSLEYVWISEVGMSMRELYQIWQANCNNVNRYVLVELKQWFGELTLNMVVRMIGGRRLDDDEGKRFQKVMNDYFHLLGLFVVSDALPYLGWLDFRGHEKAMKRTAKELDSILESWLEDHQRKKLADGTKVAKDFIDVILSMYKDESFFGYEANIAKKAICMTMITGGADTTMVTLTWALSLLLNNRNILKKAQDEIDTKVGKNRHVDGSDIENLVYLQAIVKETFRLYPTAPLSGVHEAMEDCTVAGYNISAGTLLITNVWKIQRDPRVWSNPCEFIPERFLTTHANVDVRGQHFELIPFGSGRRSCPGITFALRLVHLVLARLLQGFDFESPLNMPVDMTETSGVTNIKATPLEVLITPRLPSTLY